jgi:hypothetical protein
MPNIRGKPHPAFKYIKVKFALEQATEAQRGSKSIALLFL